MMERREGKRDLMIVEIEGFQNLRISGFGI
jgi:hypothetical protein